MRALQGQQTLMRIFVGEQDKYKHQALYLAIVQMLREEKLAGATVIRGIAGFGAKSHLHSAHLLALSQDLPMVIECVDTPDNIERILPKLDEMVTDGLVTLEKVDVIRYTPKKGD
jgi:PII-like signaling protein